MHVWKREKGRVKEFENYFLLRYAWPKQKSSRDKKRKMERACLVFEDKGPPPCFVG